MGLSRNNAVEESDWLLDNHLDELTPIGENLVNEHQGFVNNHTLPHQVLAPMQ